MKLILLFFILGACSLLNARRSLEKKWEDKWDLERLLKNIEPREQSPEKIAPKKGSGHFFRKSGFKNIDEDSDADSDQPYVTIKKRTNAKSWNGDCGIPFWNPILETEKSTKIVNGIEARPHSWPWQVELAFYVAGTYYHFCGGTIISPNVILTAAHCLFNKEHKPEETYNLMVLAGQHDRRGPVGDKVQVRNIADDPIVHENYSPGNSGSPNDIALLILTEPLEFDEYVRPACLPNSVDDVNIDQCYSTGWGNQRYGPEDTSTALLMQIRLPVFDISVCKNAYGEKKIKNTMICAGYTDGTKDTCQGDSGGPLVCSNYHGKWTVYGIVSWGEGCATEGYPGLYTRVYSFLDWIANNI